MRDEVLQRKVKERLETFNPEVVRDFTDSLIKAAGDENLFQGMDSGQDDLKENLDLLLMNMVVAGTSQGLFSPPFTLFHPFVGYFSFFTIHYLQTICHLQIQYLNITYHLHIQYL